MKKESLINSFCALKAQDMTAQGNALGQDVEIEKRPEGASQKEFNHSCFVPEGLDENSPRFQPWVRDSKNLSPIGTAEVKLLIGLSVVPSGLDLAGALPSVETLGYYRLSLRDKSIFAMRSFGSGFNFLRNFAFIFFLFISSFIFADDKPVSFYHELVPILKRSCTGCHHPGKLKGELDVTTYSALKKGGKHGASFKPGNPKESELFDQISGQEPSMPKEGDALSKEEVALFEKWIRDGATDDTPDLANEFKLTKPPEYSAPPVISALAYSPDGKTLAISGYHEVLLHKPDGSGVIARLVGESPRIESIAFSPDGKKLAVSGGAPARFGQIQIWAVETHEQINSFKISDDSLYGVNFSPDGKSLAFGCADKALRKISATDGKELIKFDGHGDWVLGAMFTHDGKRILSCSRDRAMKLIDAKNGQHIDDINKLLEPILCFARHPKQDLVVYGGELGMARIYKISDNQNRGAGDTARDANLVREFERQPGAIHAVSFSAGGSCVAIGGMGGEVRIYTTSDGKRSATLKGHDGAIFSIAFHPDSKQVATGGYDGKVRIFNSESGELIKEFIPVPIKSSEKVAAIR